MAAGGSAGPLPALQASKAEAEHDPKFRLTLARSIFGYLTASLKKLNKCQINSVDQILFDQP